MPEPTSIDSMVGIQIISSGPDTQTRQIRDNYLELFHKARHHIYIQTPYFVPDDAVLSAIRLRQGQGLYVRDDSLQTGSSVCILGDLFVCGRPLKGRGQMLVPVRMVSFMQQREFPWMDL